MKICIVADVLGEPNNGTTLACFNLIDHLRSEGHEVRVLCPDRDKKGKDGYYIVPTLYIPFFMKYLAKNGVSLSKPSKKVIERALDGVDVCHMMIPFALSRSALKVCKKKNIPVTAGFHCQAENLSAHLSLMGNALANKAIYSNFYHRFYKKVDAVHYPTEFIRNIFEKSVGHETKGHVISNGVNDIFRKTGSETTPYQILSIGRYSKEKSQETLLRAVAKSRYRDRIKIFLAGQGPREAYLKRQIKKLGLENVTMKFCTREELVKVINESDLYVHAAKVEIEAIGCLEAIRCGIVPVISDSPRSATGAFALGENNLFKCDDADDLAKKIDYWFDHSEEKAACSTEYLKYSGQFSQKECMKKMTRMLEDVIKGHEG